eukprot:NODE_2979_length_613_cov_364.984043_g2486_i0.p2 GENE.NODE_2979_length_613_cov_364.984043_g2486_i0~~NODE_2979_length_613_cov_364.984043_g2486_i0.p2  ORF type:complete len:151 (+),score=23.55 NODE_2979_length_613_cov_364.984043_g2486_i0:85-537(+)
MTYRARSNKKRKSQHMRGHVSHGHGRIGKHRKHASGRGNAGGQHHHRIAFDKYHPGSFGKVGMRHFHWTKGPRFQPAVGLDKVLSMVPAKELEATKGKPELPVVNLLKQGYFKLLGRGHIPRGVIVKARSFSRKAEQKIKKAGGACVLVA